MIDSRKQLLKEIEAFLALHGMSESAFGLKTSNDSKIVPRIRDGRSVRLEHADRIRQFMSDYGEGPVGNVNRVEHRPAA
jgi:hypothetical protein